MKWGQDPQRRRISSIAFDLVAAGPRASRSSDAPERTEPVRLLREFLNLKINGRRAAQNLDTFIARYGEPHARADGLDTGVNGLLESVYDAAEAAGMKGDRLHDVGFGATEALRQTAAYPLLAPMDLDQLRALQASMRETGDEFERYIVQAWAHAQDPSADPGRFRFVHRFPGEPSGDAELDRLALADVVSTTSVSLEAGPLGRTRTPAVSLVLRAHDDFPARLRLGLVQTLVEDMPLRRCQLRRCSTWYRPVRRSATKKYCSDECYEIAKEVRRGRMADVAPDED